MVTPLYLYVHKKGLSLLIFHFIFAGPWKKFVCVCVCVYIYTGWRKKNACFSNNCNFVYFQYKKIMSTPKQPVINAVLIAYINYSITENYIRKMASFLPYTRLEPLLEALHHIY